LSAEKVLKIADVEKEKKVRLSLTVPPSAKADLDRLAANFPGITPGDVLGELIAFAVVNQDVMNSLVEEFADWEEMRKSKRKEGDAERKRRARRKLTSRR
jgi:hypothetical protein